MIRTKLAAPTEAEELIRSAKFSQMNAFLSNTAHELAQPTQIILNLSELADRLLQQDPANLERVGKLNQKVIESARRLAKILEKIRETSRREQPKTQAILLTELSDLLLSESRGDLETSIPEGLFAHADPTHLKQILLNLIQNAREACAGLDGAKNPLIRLEARAFENWIRFKISDRGPGIPLQEQSQVFKASFTTKPPLLGTGLGLPICAQLVKQNQGRIFFGSEPGHTVFVVDLPLPITPS